MMKQKAWYISILLVLLIISCFGIAMAAPGDATLLAQIESDSTNLNIQSFTADGDALYTLTNDGALYHYQLGMAEPTIVAENIFNPSNYSSQEDFEKDTAQSITDGIDYIYLKDGQLYSLNLLTGQFSTVTIIEGAVALNPIITLDLTPVMMGDDDTFYPALLEDAIFTGNALYLLVNDYSSSSYGKYILAAYTLTDSQAKVYSTPHIMAITPYKEGKMLVKVFDREHAHDDPSGQEKYAELHILDLATDTTKMVMEFDGNSITGLHYRADNDTLYYFSNGSIMMMPALGTPQLAAYLPIDWVDKASTALMKDGLYVAASYRGIFIKNTDLAYLPTTTLNVYGGYADNASLAFSINNPDVTLNYSQEYYDNAQALIQAMISGDSTLDVLILNTEDGTFASMMEKGYCVDLSGYEKIAKATQSLYPFVQDAITADGKIYAIPLHMDQTTDSYNYFPLHLSETNLTLEDLPTNYIALCQFITRWNNEWMDAYDSMRPLFWTNRNNLYYTLIGQYKSYYEYIGEELTFDTPLFRSLMAAFESIDSSNLDLPEDASDEDEEAIWDFPVLIDSYIGGSIYSDKYSPDLPMTLTPDTDGFVGYSLQVAFINPRSQNIDAAMHYLASYLDYMDGTSKVMLFSDINEPILDPYFNQNVATWTDALASLEARLPTCLPEDKNEIEMDIAYFKDRLASQEDQRYLLTAEEVANYNENVVPIAFVRSESLLYTDDQGSSELRTLQERYLAKQITLEQFIKDADNKLQMMFLERQ